MEEIKAIRLGNVLDEHYGTGFAGNVWDINGVCPSLTTFSGGNRQPMIIVPDSVCGGGGYYECLSRKIVREQRSDECIKVSQDGRCETIRTIDGSGDKRVIKQIIVASRGRNPDNPSDRRSGIRVEQRLEPNQDGICNTLTSVQKDNYILEIFDEEK